jgi:hypothetical protein
MSDAATIVRARVASLVDAGHTLAEIEHEVLEDDALSEEEQAALWLYAWGRRRRETGVRGRQRRRASVPDIPFD